MKRATTVITGALAFVPLIYMIFAVLLLAPVMTRDLDRYPSDYAWHLNHDRDYTRLNIPHAVIVLLYLAAIVFFIVRIFLNRRIRLRARFLWAVGILFVSQAVAPIYFFLKVWPGDHGHSPEAVRSY